MPVNMLVDLHIPPSFPSFDDRKWVDNFYLDVLEYFSLVNCSSTDAEEASIAGVIKTGGSGGMCGVMPEWRQSFTQVQCFV